MHVKSILLPLTYLMFSAFLFKLQASTTGNWTSRTTGTSIVYTVTESATPAKDLATNYVTVVYLENLAFNKVGQNSNETDVAWLLSKGYRVIELNYANHANAVTPEINKDIIDINKAINSGSFCGLSNCSKLMSYVLFEGYRISRNVSYFKDDPTVYNWPGASYTVGDSLHMDIIYPANPVSPVPVVLSFSYSNSYATAKDQRMNLGYTLAGFNDSFLEGAPARGIAWAIADHPKYCNWGNGKPTGGTNDTYKSYEVNPDAAQKVKSAVRTLRVLGQNLGLSGKIGIYGFSRGSDAGSMAVGDRVVESFENAGLYVGTNDDVQVAALGSGVFDFTQIYNTVGDGDGNLETRCPWAWGALADNYARWEQQGSAYLAQTNATAPVIFFYNNDDAAYYRDQIARFKAKLDLLGVTTGSVVDYGTGHAVPQTSASLNSLYNFFSTYLSPPDVSTGISIPGVNQENEPAMQISVNSRKDEILLQCNLPKAGNVRVSICYITGVCVYSHDLGTINGQLNQTIKLSPGSLPTGIYILKLDGEQMSGQQKFLI